MCVHPGDVTPNRSTTWLILLQILAGEDSGICQVVSTPEQMVLPTVSALATKLIADAQGTKMM